MSQKFKLRFDEMREGKPTHDDLDSTENPYQEFASSGHVRNLCFVWADGKMKFLNYAYLVSAEYEPEEGKILIIYTSCVVKILGSKLKTLFEQLLHHLPKTVMQVEQRYAAISSDEFVITDLIVEELP